jgi:signal recognition particle GTPase
LYELPLFAAPRLVEVTVSVAGVVLTVIDSCTEAVCVGDALSVTDTVKLDVPVFVGVPEITPPLDNASPAGKLPEAIDHV